jgi:hypothetical protein
LMILKCYTNLIMCKFQDMNTHETIYSSNAKQIVDAYSVLQV